MISGAYQGRLLEMLSLIHQPRRALEIGTFTGYAAICIARGLAEDGILTTIEVNPERERLIRQSIDDARMTGRVQLIMADALEYLEHSEAQYDFVYIDAGKRDNPKYYDLCIERLDAGGLIVLDNVLWGGKVVDGATDPDSRAIDAMNKKLISDSRVDCLMLPIRDGLTIVRKK